MPTLAQTKTRANNWFTALGVVALLGMRQENYRGNKGTYWQITRSHSLENIPAHTSENYQDSAPDQLNENAADPYENWGTVFPEWEGTDLPAAIEVNIYGDATSGKGWQVVLFFSFDGTLYSRGVNIGPDANRSYDWKDHDTV